MKSKIILHFNFTLFSIQKSLNFNLKLTNLCRFDEWQFSETILQAFHSSEQGTQIPLTRCCDVTKRISAVPTVYSLKVKMYFIGAILKYSR